MIQVDTLFLITEVCDRNVVGGFLHFFVAYGAIGIFKGRVSKEV